MRFVHHGTALMALVLSLVLIAESAATQNLCQVPTSFYQGYGSLKTMSVAEAIPAGGETVTMSCGSHRFHNVTGAFEFLAVIVQGSKVTWAVASEYSCTMVNGLKSCGVLAFTTPAGEGPADVYMTARVKPSNSAPLPFLGLPCDSASSTCSGNKFTMLYTADATAPPPTPAPTPAPAIAKAVSRPALANKPALAPKAAPAPAPAPAPKPAPAPAPKPSPKPSPKPAAQTTPAPATTPATTSAPPAGSKKKASENPASQPSDLGVATRLNENIKYYLIVGLFLFCGGAAFLGYMAFASGQGSVATVLGFFIALVGLVTYLTMFSGLTVTEIHQPPIQHAPAPVARALLGIAPSEPERYVFLVRYLCYIVAAPLMGAALVGTGQPMYTNVGVGGAYCMMWVVWLFGTLTVGGLRFMYWTLGNFLLIGAAGLLLPLLKELQRTGEDDTAVYRGGVAAVLVACSLLHSLEWLFGPPGFFLIGVPADTVCLLFLDIVAMIGFPCLLLLVVPAKPVEELYTPLIDSAPRYYAATSTAYSPYASQPRPTSELV